MNCKSLIRSLVAMCATAIVMSGLRAEAKPQAAGPSEADVKKITEAAPDRATATPAKPRKVFIFDLTQGFPHASIPYGDKALEILGKKTGAYEATVSRDKSVFTTESLAQYDGIVFNNTTKLTFDDAARKALLDFVKGGKGLIGIHAATDNFYDWPEGVEMIGGQFSGHPWHAGGTWAVKIDEPDHPLNKGFGGKGFHIKDEIYQIKGPYSRETHRVLLSLDMADQATAHPGGKKADKKGGKKAQKAEKKAGEGGVAGRPDQDNAISWIKTFGNGRVFYCSMGHNNEIYWNTAVLQHYLDGIQWALGDLQADSTPIAKLNPKPSPALAP